MSTWHEYVNTLECRLKSLTYRVKEFETGEKYVTMKSDFKAQLAGRDNEIRKLKLELADANRRTLTNSKNNQQVLEDMEKEHARELREKDRTIKAMEERAFRAERRLDEKIIEFRGKVTELYEVKTELEEANGIILKLKSQINRDYENSSNPSSMKPNHKKIVNNREKTGRSPGGQPGHEGRPRKKHIPTNTIEIPVPEKYANNPDYTPTGRIIRKQLVDISVNAVVTEFYTQEFRNAITRQRVHAEFPEGMVNEVTYSGNVKAFAFLLNNRCNVSIIKTSEFLSELTGGELNISAGMINGLSREFSLKTEAEQKKAFADILLAPVMNVDLTTARVNGKNMNVAVCATPDTVIYFAREHKGHEGIKDTPIETYQGTLVHDHDKTFYSYGGAHQECLQHPLRYLKGIMENEPDLKWSLQMRALIQEMIHFRNGLDPGDDRDPDQIDPDKVKEFETRYDEILTVAKDEYEFVPPNKYYLDGFNLYKKMDKYKAEHLLFLHDRRVPPTNNLSERLLRVIKRKLAQVMAFRSFDGLDYLCISLGPIATMAAQDVNLYENVASIFDMLLPTNAGVKTAS